MTVTTDCLENEIFICLYCDVKSLSEKSLRLHINRKHNVKSDEIKQTEVTHRRFFA